MTKFLKPIVVLIFLLLSQKPGLPEAAVVERIVAIVNDELILLTELESALSPLRKQYETAYEGEALVEKLAQAKKEILNKLIDTKILLQEARSRSIEVSPQEANAMLENVKKTFASEDKFKEALREQKLALDKFIKRLEDQLRIKRLVDQEVKLKINVGIEEIRHYYETNKNKFFHDTQYRIKHILIKDSPGGEAEKKAQEALAKIKEGEDFSILVKEYSEDPNAPSGGDLGFLEKDKLIPEIREAIETLKVGQISEVIKTRLGYQIIKVEAIKEVEAKKFDEVKEEIRQKFFQEKFAETYQVWLAELKENSYIYIKKENLEQKEKDASDKEETLGEIERKILVSSNKHNFVIISVGEENGVKIGDRFSVYRSDKKIGEIEITNIRPGSSYANIISLEEGVVLTTEDTLR